MSAFCWKYPNCGCVGIGTKCDEKTVVLTEEQRKVIGVTGDRFMGCNVITASRIPCAPDNRGLSKKKIRKNLQKLRRKS
jgi:hypothetical protein